MLYIDEDKRVLRRDVPWTDFARFVDQKGDRGIPRITYLDGTLELLTPSREHEKYRGWIGRLLVVHALEQAVHISSYGSWLLIDKRKRVGAEPDDCYVLGKRPDQEPRPHFVIDVQWSRPTISKLEVYKRLGVHEVWCWTKPNSIAIHVLKRGEWSEVIHSKYLPDLDVGLMCSFLDRPTMSQAMLDFRSALQRQ